MIWGPLQLYDRAKFKFLSSSSKPASFPAHADDYTRTTRMEPPHMHVCTQASPTHAAHPHLAPQLKNTTHNDAAAGVINPGVKIEGI